jgi:hypothetical protein
MEKKDARRPDHAGAGRRDSQPCAIENNKAPLKGLLHAWGWSRAYRFSLSVLPCANFTALPAGIRISYSVRGFIQSIVFDLTVIIANIVDSIASGNFLFQVCIPKYLGLSLQRLFS